MVAARQDCRLRLFGAVLQILGVEAIVLGSVSYMAELWARHKLRADDEVPPRIFVGLAELTRALTHLSPLSALTVLGVLLIVLGATLRRLGSKR
jgi:hypothetical protein